MASKRLVSSASISKGAMPRLTATSRAVYPFASNWRACRSPGVIWSARLDDSHCDCLCITVSRSIAASPYRYRVRLKVKGSLAEVRARIPPWMGVLEPVDDSHCILTAGGDTYETIAALIVHTGVDFTLIE